MKISKGRRKLARLISESEGWLGGEFAVQNGNCGRISFSENKPSRQGSTSWVAVGGFKFRINGCERQPSWHQTVLSRDEFDQIVAESAERSKPDADGWIEWNGSLRLPDPGELVDVKYENGTFDRGFRAGRHEWNWRGDDGYRIIAYRLHNPEQAEPQASESVTRTIPEPVPAQTLDQLLQDYRNAADLATRRQADADDAAKMRDERWKAAQARACELGVRISVELVVDAEMRESELVITDWRDLRVGDIVIITSVFMGGGNLGYEKIIGNEAVVMVVGDPDYQGLAVDFLGSALYIDGYRFIRRP